MRTLGVLLVWVTATVIAAAAVFSAVVGRADFGDGKDPPTSPAQAVALVALACLVVAIALWLTRLLRRGG